jgi:hypothetical protein
MSENKTVVITLNFTDGKLTSKSKTETVTKEKDPQPAAGFKVNP